MVIRKTTAFLLFIAILPALVAAQPNISEKALRKHIAFLADDRLEGRGTGSEGERIASEYIAKHFRQLGLKPMGDNGAYFHNFGFKKNTDPHGANAESAPQVYSRNVAAFLDNGAPLTIVIGAHYDHIGLGYDRNSREPNPEGKIHNGADDNASGTAGVLELARYFSKNKVREKHNFLFLCFSAEELGLIGSKKFTDYPTIDLSTVNFMINMDMIGRLKPEKTLFIGGVGTAPDFVPAINSLQSPLVIRQDSSGIGASDHTSFYLKNIPSLFFFTGQHDDYHKPSDDADKINYKGEKMVLEYIAALIESLDKKPRQKFQETQSKQEETPRFKVTLGIMPDYTSEDTGLRVDGVNEGRPGHKAGLLKGDIIIGLGEYEIKDVMGYMKALAQFQKGDATDIKIQRNGTIISLPVVFE